MPLITSTTHSYKDVEPIHRNILNCRFAAIVGCLGLSSLIWIGGEQRPVSAQGSSIVPAAAQSPLPPRRLLQIGSTGSDVKDLQGMLTLMGLYSGPINGVFETDTRTAVVQFQQMAGLYQDGIVGGSTWMKLLPPAPGEAPVAVIVPAVQPVVAAPAVVREEVVREEVVQEVVQEPLEPILRNGAEGPAVIRLQQRLQALGLYDGPIDGGFGDITEDAVKAAQSNAGLEVDGIVGPATWQAIR